MRNRWIALFGGLLALTFFAVLPAAAQGIDIAFVGPDAFAVILRGDMAKYAKVIKAANIKMEN